MQDIFTKPLQLDVDVSRHPTAQRSAERCRLCGGAGIVTTAGGNRVSCPGCLNKQTELGPLGASVITK